MKLTNNIIEMKTKVSIIIALIVAFAIGGCNFFQKKEKSSNKKEVIKIGAILPLTGGVTSGIYSRDGLILAIEEYNQKSKNDTVIYQIFNHDSDPKKAINALNHINRGDIADIIYCQQSGPSLAIQPITEKNNQILIAVSGSEQLLTNSKNTFRNYVEPSSFGRIASHLLKDSLNITEISILYSNDDFGLSLFKALEKNFNGLNINVLFSEAYNGKSNDFRGLVTKLLSSKPQNIYLIGIGNSLGLLIKQIREAGYTGQIIGGIETSLPDVVSIAQKYMNNIKYIDFAFNEESNNPKTQKFVKKYLEHFGEKPTIPSIIAYDAINLILYNYKIIKKNPAISIAYEGPFGKITLENHNIIYPLALKTYKYDN